jgi:bla regulator protein blaR1
VSALLSADWTLLGRQVANHLWQSTLFALVAGMLALSLRNNHARLRHWLWMAASVKFLVPFSLIVALGGYFGQSIAPRAAAPRIPAVAVEIAQPFALRDSVIIPSAPMPQPRPNPLPLALAAVWLCGFTVIVVNWQRKWQRVAAIVHASRPLTQGREAEALLRVRREGPGRLRLVSSDARLEPGLFGIFRPVLWLPKGISDYLSDTQLDAILAHELCHARRRDNLLAAVHMVVEAGFWFHPLVWWLGSRLEEERERACDEEVLRLTGEPQAYAEGVLKVCEFYLTSPVFCAAGVTGADLKRRIKSIVANRAVRELNFAKRALLVAAAATALAVPITAGWWSRVAQAAVQNAAISAPDSQDRGAATQVNANPAPSRTQTSSPVVAAAVPARRAFEVASVKPAKPVRGYTGIPPAIAKGEVNLRFPNATLKGLIMRAFAVSFEDIIGPSWIDEERYEVMAKAAAGSTPDEVASMLQDLLAERFALRAHWTSKQISGYALVVNNHAELKIKSAGTIESAFGKGDSGGASVAVVMMDPSKGDQAPVTAPAGHFDFKRTPLDLFARNLSQMIGSPVKDATGLKGAFDITFDCDPSSLADMPPGVAGTVNAPSVFTAIRELGFELQPRISELKQLVVDSARKSPSEN